MARLVISFKDKSEEEMKLYKEILKRACGDNSAYVKSVFRQLYNIEGYTYTISRTKKDNKDNSEEEVATTIEEEEIQDKVVEEVKEEVNSPTENKVEENISDDFDDEIELEELPEKEIIVQAIDTEDSDSKKVNHSTGFGSMNIAAYLKGN